MNFRGITSQKKPGSNVEELSDLELDPDPEAFPLTAAAVAVVGGVAATAVALDPDGT